MNFEQAWEYLLNSGGAGRKKGHDAILSVMAHFDNPQEKLRIIHVAGTNGKGSFCAMMGSVLKEAGYRVGVFTSPHLERVNERFTINGEEISDKDLAKYVTSIVSLSEDMYGKEDGFTYFEILTMVAFLHFHKQKVDFVLLEVGIGGRLDSTNIITKPLLSVIMSIGMDHMEMLGNTIEEIAREKGGIIKQDCPVVLYDDEPKVHNIFLEMARAKNAIVYKGSEVICNHDIMRIGLLGSHQGKNASVVFMAAVALEEMGAAQIGRDALDEGLARARHPGRMEIMAENPMIILEGAHNLQGVEACVKNFKRLDPMREVTIIMAMMNDKEYHHSINLFATFAARIIFTKPYYDGRAVNPHELAAVLEYSNKETFVREDCKDALELARSLSPEDGIILCTGSLYLVADIRKILMDERRA